MESTVKTKSVQRINLSLKLAPNAHTAASS